MKIILLHYAFSMGVIEILGKRIFSLAVIGVLVTAQMSFLDLQLLCTHHGRADSSISCPMELTQVNLNAKKHESKMICDADKS